LEHARVVGGGGGGHAVAVDGAGADRGLEVKKKKPNENFPDFLNKLKKDKDLFNKNKKNNNNKKNNKDKKNNKYYDNEQYYNSSDYYGGEPEQDYYYAVNKGKKENSEFEDMKYLKKPDYMTDEHLHEMLNHDKSATKHGGSFQSYQSTPFSQGPGTHYSTVWVGTPAQRVTVIADTGSHHTAFPCDKCSNCGDKHNDLYFNPERSSTFKYDTCDSCPGQTSCHNNKCEYGQSYREGSSWRAYSSIDTFVLGPNHATGKTSNGEDVTFQADKWLAPSNLERFAIDFTFGCQFKLTGMFKDQLADGIMGLDKQENTIVKAMYRAKKIDNQMFSMCFKKSLEVSQASVTAGVLTIGGVDERLQYGPMIYARSDFSSNSWFRVNVKGVYLGRLTADDAKDLKIVTTNEHDLNSGSGVIIDSGTTDTYLSKKFKTAFNKLWLEIPSTLNQAYNPSGKMSYTEEQMANLPIVYIQLETNDPLADEMAFKQLDMWPDEIHKKKGCMVNILNKDTRGLPYHQIHPKMYYWRYLPNIIWINLLLMVKLLKIHTHPVFRLRKIPGGYLVPML